MKILIIANLSTDNTASMHTFSRSISEGVLSKRIKCTTVSPRPLMSLMGQGFRHLGKWLGYIDKYVFFPVYLRCFYGNYDIVHICDHSNAVYGSIFYDKYVIVTCHDLLAVRSALNDYCACHVSCFGRYLQEWIVRGIAGSRFAACVSSVTYHSMSKVVSTVRARNMVANAICFPYKKMSTVNFSLTLKRYAICGRKYLLHVGSGMSRKNRRCLLRVFSKIMHEENIYLVVVGDFIGIDMSAYARKLGVMNKVIHVFNVSREELGALYSQAEALVFPSRFEGFGWPPIEAQACGCPVIASDIPSAREVLGESAILCSVDDEQGIVDSIFRLLRSKSTYAEARRKGYTNVHERFSYDRMISEYTSLYERASCAS